MYPVKIISVEKSRSLEKAASEGGLSYAEMMENAGRRTAQAVVGRLGTRDIDALVLVGPGNNGGDGLVTAHYLAQMGAMVTCYVWKRSGQDDANLHRVRDAGIRVVWADHDAELEGLRTLLSSTEVVVDALLGVGGSRPISGVLEHLLQVVRGGTALPSDEGLLEVRPRRDAKPPPLVVAVDCPTGLDCDTGALDPAALRADLTVTFAYPKAGLFRFPGAEAVGDLVVADIGIPPNLAEDVPLEMATAQMVRDWLPRRPRSAHKGTFGRALIVAGSVHYVGAAALAAAAAARVGTGLVTVGLPLPIHGAVSARLAEATYLLLPHDLGVVNAGAVAVVQEAMSGYEAMLLGPGLTHEKEAVAFVHSLVGLEPSDRRGQIGFVVSKEAEEVERHAFPPLIVDADGLNALASAEKWWQALPPETVLTPHAGEMSRLMGGEMTVQEIQADREGVSQRMAAKWKVVVVLKGAFTVVSAPDGRLVVLPFANPGLATAGTGDVLAGTIVGLRAQGLGAFEASVAGAYVHGLAGELVRADFGSMGMVAGDLLLSLPRAIQQVQKGA